jgi:pimeloyl-ACP methyl ester carboxylesterase
METAAITTTLVAVAVSLAAAACGRSSTSSGAAAATTVTSPTTRAVLRPSDPIDELVTISGGRLHIRCTEAGDKPPTTQSFETQVADLHELFDEIGEPGTFVVVGHSFGGAERLLVDDYPPFRL